MSKLEAQNEDAESQHVRVLVIDDHPLFRKGVAQLLAMDPNMSLVAEAANGDDGVLSACQHVPDLILLDMHLGGGSGIETLCQLREKELKSLVVMLTVSNSGTNLSKALRAGADGYLLKDMEPEEILAHLRRAVAGEVVIAPSLFGELASVLRDEQSVASVEAAGLTPRETEILRCVSQGSSNKHVARVLMISESTVKVHMKNILRKLKLGSRLEAAIWALNHGVD